MVGVYSEIIIRIAIFLYALWIGGLATTIYNRIPNEIPIGPSQKPCCNNCKREITFKYFFPVLGYFFSNGKCIYCGMKIPRIYLVIELSIMLYILTLSMTFDFFDEKFISKSLYGAFIIVLMFIYNTHKKIKLRLIWMLASFIFMYRGYNNCLPNVIDLFISCVSSFSAFLILNKHTKIQTSEFEICTIIISSLGYLISIVSLVVAILCHIILSIPFLEKKIMIKSAVVVFISLALALIITYIK